MADMTVKTGITLRNVKDKMEASFYPEVTEKAFIEKVRKEGLEMTFDGKKLIQIIGSKEQISKLIGIEI